MRRIVCFAHYDAFGMVQDFVVYYLAELKKVAEIIIFVSDSYISSNELEKIKPYVNHIVAEPHGEYDFGSYKKGYFYAKENGLLENCDELIFANDSCYAPLFSFEEMFSKMSYKNLDFWGATENNQGIRGLVPRAKHVQSYFLVFKPPVFNNKCFIDFMSSIKKEPNKESVVANYEIGLSLCLIENNFRYDVYCDLSKIINDCFITDYKNLIKENRNPFLKRSIILYKTCDIKYPVCINYFIKRYTKYNYDLIKKDRKKNKRKLSFFNHLKLYYRTIRRDIISVHINIKAEISILGNNYKISNKKESA